MNTIAVVDTHALIWFLEETPLLGKKAEEILTNPASTLIIPVIVLCELYAYLKKKKKIESYKTIYENIVSDKRFTIKNLIPDLIFKIPVQLELHDGIIAATLSEIPGAVLLSKDEELKVWAKEAIVWS